MEKTKIILAIVSIFLVVSLGVHLYNWMVNWVRFEYERGLKEGLSQSMVDIFKEIPAEGQSFDIEQGIIILIPQ